MARITVDLGRSGMKVWCQTPNGRNGKRQLEIPSLVARIDEKTWERDSNGGLPPDGFVNIGKNYYVVGERAKQYGGDYMLETSRLVSTHFYLPLLLYGLSQMAGNGSADAPIQLIIGLTYSSGDYQTSKKMRSFLLGDKGQAKNESFVRHCRTSRGDSFFNFVRKDISLFDEPYGTLAYRLWNDAGDINESSQLSQSLLLLDLGGHTVDIVPVHSSAGVKLGRVYTPVLSNANSLAKGVLHYQSGLWRDLRDAFAELRDITTEPNRHQINTILRTDMVPYGNKFLDASNITKKRKRAMAHDIYESLRQYSPLEYPQIVLTGGGAPLVFDDIYKRFPDFTVELAMPETDNIQFTNVRGVARLLASVYGNKDE
jgi:hypothetical protein